MTHTFKLERLDGTPADPPRLSTAVPNWGTGDTIALGPGRMLRVVRRWLMEVIEETCPLEDRSAERVVFGGTPNAYQGVMVRACRNAGIPAFTPHDLRHRRLSLWHGQGIPAAELAARAGHSKSSMTLDVYSHVLLDPTEATEDELLALIAS